jgi:hypothetical protein
VISNKHGFIFIHVPKTGGTSISAAFDIDLEQECKVEYGEDGKSIDSIYPSSKDFPWWGAWIRDAYGREEAAHAADVHWGSPYRSIAERLFSFYTDPREERYGARGNIKHLCLDGWINLLSDERIKHYGSFLPKYKIIGSCRNPYEREFSHFMYNQHAYLLESTQNISTSLEISQIIIERWKNWVGPKVSTASDRAAYFNGTKSQVDYLCFINDGDNRLYGPDHLIHLENNQEDYRVACEMVGIERKTKLIPHLIQRHGLWSKYLPADVLELYGNREREIIHRERELDFKFLGYEKAK